MKRQSTIIRPILAIVLVAVGFSFASAQTIPTDAAAASLQAPPAEDLVAQALLRSPALAKLKSQWASAREMVMPAGALEDPMLEVSAQESFPLDDSPSLYQATAEISQQLPFPGKNKARRNAAGAQADVRAAEYKAMQASISSRVRTLYANIYAIDQEAKSLDAARDLLDLLAAAAKARYSVGEGGQEPLIKAQLSISRLMERKEDLLSLRASNVADLNRILDLPGDAPFGEVNALPDIAAPDLDAAPEKIDLSPQVLTGQAGVTAAEKKLDSARRESYPDFLVGLGGGVDSMLDPMVMLRFGITLPIWRKSKQLPLVRAAKEDLNAALSELRDARASTRSDLARLNDKLRRDRRLIALFEQGILPQTHAALDAARGAYIAGQGDFSTVIEDFNLWLDARTELARRRADLYATWSQIQALVSAGPDSEGGAK